MTASATVRASAPVRLDFAGAWTDVAPFATEERGVVVNAAIDLRSVAEIQLQCSNYHLSSDDLGEKLIADTHAELSADGRLTLLKAAIRRNRLGPCALRTSAQAPPGSGLGTSGALSVALVAAIAAAEGRTISPIHAAHEAWLLETTDAAIPGGQQDQYAAALGGFQQLIFAGGRCEARQLAIDAGFAAELARHTVICYTGRSRFSGNAITRVMHAYAARDTGVVSALHALVDIADAMAEAFAVSDLDAIGYLLGRNWLEQQRLTDGMCTVEMHRLELAMQAAGAIGGKAAGAGAGGSMFFIVPGDTSAALRAARECGATVLPTCWANRGVTLD